MRRFNFIFILILSIIIFHAINNYIWLKNDNCSFEVDVLFHLKNQVSFHFDFKNILSFEPIFEVLSKIAHLFNKYSLGNWPPLMYFITSLFTCIFGYSLFLVKFSQVGYFAILLISTYLIGRECFNKRAGLLAMFIVSMYPAIFGLSRMYELDLPLTCATSLCLYLLLLTRHFQNRMKSLLFGILLGFGIMIKGQILFFMIGPLTNVLYTSLFKGKNSHAKKISIYNFIISMVFALSISSLWWFGRIKLLGDSLYYHFIAFYSPLCPDTIFVWRSIYDMWGYIPYKSFTSNWAFFYLYQAITQMSLFLFLIFIIGFFSYIKSARTKNKQIIVLWIIAPYIIFTAISCKWGRYYFPSFPAFALISAVGILEFRQKKIRTVLISSIIVIGLAQFFKLSYGLEKIPYVSVSLPTPSINWNPSPEKSDFKYIIHSFADEINKIVDKDSSVKIGIIGGDEVKVAYFLKCQIPNLLVYEGHDIEELLLQAKNLDFLIILESLGGQYGGLLKIRKDYRRQQIYRKMYSEKDIDDLLVSFEKYRTIKSEISAHQNLYITLRKKTKDI